MCLGVFRICSMELEQSVREHLEKGRIMSQYLDIYELILPNHGKVTLINSLLTSSLTYTVVWEYVSRNNLCVYANNAKQCEYWCTFVALNATFPTGMIWEPEFPALRKINEFELNFSTVYQWFFVKNKAISESNQKAFNTLIKLYKYSHLFFLIFFATIDKNSCE